MSQNLSAQFVCPSPNVCDFDEKGFIGRPYLVRALANNRAEKILKGSLDSISSPSPSVKIQIMGGKVCLMCKGKTLLGVLKTKSLLTSPSNVLPYYLK